MELCPQVLVFSILRGSLWPLFMLDAIVPPLESASSFLALESWVSGLCIPEGLERTSWFWSYVPQLINVILADFSKLHVNSARRPFWNSSSLFAGTLQNPDSGLWTKLFNNPDPPHYLK